MVANVKARDAENHPIALTGARPVLPTQTALSPAFPNPFGHTTRLDLAIARPGHVSVMVYDLGGRLVRRLVEGDLPASKQTLQWDGTDDGGRSLPAGLYLVRMEAPGATMSHRIVRMP